LGKKTKREKSKKRAKVLRAKTGPREEWWLKTSPARNQEKVKTTIKQQGKDKKSGGVTGL